MKLLHILTINALLISTAQFASDPSSSLQFRKMYRLKDYTQWTPKFPQNKKEICSWIIYLSYIRNPEEDKFETFDDVTRAYDKNPNAYIKISNAPRENLSATKEVAVYFSGPYRSVQNKINKICSTYNQPIDDKNNGHLLAFEQIEQAFEDTKWIIVSPQEKP